MTSKNSTNLIIDIRSHNEFLTEHIEGATNIPLSEILEEDYFSFLKEADQKSTTIVIIGKDLLQANASWLLLKQLGIKNLKLLASGYNLKSLTNEVLLTETTQIEVQFFNDSIVKQLENPSIKGDAPSNNIKEKITPVKKQKKATTGGGC
jgi:rhodanese-related sulfurtransferase